MHAIGRNPDRAIPAAMSTVQLSAMPQSSVRSGIVLRTLATPVPSGMAAVSVKRRGSLAAILRNASAYAVVQLLRALFTIETLSPSTLNLSGLWNAQGSFDAHEQPRPFSV